MDDELKKNLKDKDWRIQNLYKIRTKKGTISTLKYNPAQAAYMKARTKRDIILKARQLGFSTLKLIEMLDRTIWSPNTTSVIIAHKRESVQKLFRIIKFAYDNWPAEVPKPAAKYDSKNELFFHEINSTIYVGTSIRGDTVNNLHVSELAFMDDAEDRMIATFAAIPPDGTICIESTANGIGNYFYDFYTTGEERGFSPKFFPWYLDAGYTHPADGIEFSDEDRKIQKRYKLSEEQLAWYTTTKKIYRDKFAQEFPSNALEAFIASGINVFPIEELDKMEPKDAIINRGGEFIWEEPCYGAKYTVGVDVAEGINKDEQAIDVINNRTGEQVWHWSGNCTVPLLAEKVEAVAKNYNQALVIPEANNHGFALIHMLQDRGLYLYKREKFDGPYVKRVERLGWMTTKRTKPLMIQALTTALYEKDIKINNRKTLGQMRTFVTNPETGKMEAATGKKDDCVMSLALAWQGIRIEPAHDRRPFDSFVFNQGTTITY